LQVNDLRDRLAPSNQRDWAAELARLPYAQIDNDQVQLHNIRDLNYVTESDFVLEYDDRSFRLGDIQSVDYIVVPFQGMPLIAHTMLSFGMTGGEYIAVSAEIRNEKEEKYSPLLGISNQFEIMYVVASERDLIRLRTRHRDADVYIYPTIATPEQAQALFVDIMRRANQLAEVPEFYHTLANNCTTNLFDHVRQLQSANAISPLQYGWQVLFTGYSDRLAYDAGLLKTNLSFEETKQLAYVNDLAEAHYDAADFSLQIRRRQLAMTAWPPSDNRSR